MGIRRVLVVGALAVVGFVAAVVAIDDVPFSECQAESRADPSYEVALELTPGEYYIMYGTRVPKRSSVSNPATYHLKVTQNGQPVSGADVCLRADRAGAGETSAMATNAVAKETRPGEYGVTMTFDTAGHWDVHALIRRPGQRPVDVPFAIDAR